MNSKRMTYRIGLMMAVLVAAADAATIPVTTTNDSGAGSLRQAILDANLSTGVTDRITFSIGTGRQTITLATALPLVTDTATIDGYTQPGSSSNTSVTADNAVLNIKLVGSSLALDASNSMVRGLVVVGAHLIGIGLNGPGSVIEGNFVGVDFDGVTPAGGMGDGLSVLSANNRIGGTSPGARNIVANRNPGIEVVQNATPVVFVTNNVIQGNFIGVDATGIGPAGNNGAGIQNSMAPTNMIGGTAPGAGNVIGYNNQGVALQGPGCKALGNSIFSSFAAGINASSSTTVAPVLTGATNTTTTTILGVTLGNTNTIIYRVEFFASPFCNDSGKTLIGSTNIPGLTTFTMTFPRLGSSQVLTATATGPDTSAFSACLPIFTPFSPGSTNSWTNSVSAKWEDDFSWSLGVAPATNHSAILITNAVTKTITNDTITALDHTGTMSISNLFIGAPSGSTNTLLLLNAPTNIPLRVFRSLLITNGGALIASNASVQVDGLSSGVFNIDGPLALNTGTLLATNTTVNIGRVGRGSLSLSNATARLGFPTIGVVSGSQGTLTAAASTITAPGTLYLAFNAATSGTVWLADSRLELTNLLSVGFIGFGQFTASNSTVRASTGLQVGSAPGARGIYTAVNTTNVFGQNLGIGQSGAATGSMFVAGGQLVVTNGSITVGDSGSGELTVSNTTLLTTGIKLGNNPGSAGTFTFAGGSTVALSLTSTGTAFGATSTLLVTGGQLTLTNTTTLISTTGLSRVTISNGTMNVGSLTVIPSASAGTLTVAGGVINISGQLTCVSTGVAVWVTGGQVIATNLDTYIGQMVISNGAYVAHDVFLANGQRGTITVAGGVLAAPGGGNGLIVGANHGTGTVWQTGGLIVTTNANISIGGFGTPPVGQLNVTNGTLLASNVFVGTVSGGQGTFTIAGGTNSVYSSLILGYQACGGTGTVNVTAGQLFVTNAAHNAVLDVRSGTLNISGGYVQADKIILTNACAHFAHTGGTLVYSSAVLDPARDDDGDGYSNGFEQSHGLDPLNPADINADNDGDGLSNIEEVLAGTDFNNANSALRITSIVQSGPNINITWSTAGGHTNRVVFATPVPDGSFTNEFSNLSAFIIIPGSGDTSTNYIDNGGATNSPSRYYRIRLIP